ncbi:MAG: tetratricopeptide repeat protein [Deltaproteobacteria bacterium]|nr:tetratricopeptide repeat protein [Deltaproteobacteria bacterium]
MSIILDALKKSEKKDGSGSEKSNDDSGAGIYQPDSTSPGRVAGSKSKTILLAALLLSILVAVGLFIFGPNIKEMFMSSEQMTIKPLPKIAKKAPKPELSKEEQEKQNKTDKIDKLKTDAMMNFQNQKFAQAASNYQDLIQIVPDDAQTYNNYGVALKKIGKLNEAKRQYETALALKPDYTEAMNNLAVVHLAERSYHEAKSLLEKALAINPDYLDAQLHLALCLEKLGELTTAVNTYQDFLDNSEGVMNRTIRLQVETRLARLKEDL